MSFELKITRTFNAPRELVWRAWTEPELAKQWMGPRGFRAIEFTNAREVGARWHMTMEGNIPGTEKLACLNQGGTTLEMRPPELLKYTFAWDRRSDVGLGPSEFEENVVTIRLEEAPGNKTIVHFHQAPFATEAERDGHNGGWNSSLDKFAEFLAAQQPERTEAAEDVPTELHLKRTFQAPRAMVFEAWTNPELVRTWWGPRGFTTEVETWDARGGGEIRVTMVGPDGSRFPMGGRFVEVYPPYRFHFIAIALDLAGKELFRNWNSVFLEEQNGATTVTLDVHVMSQTAANADMYLKGMTQGWSMSLDKLEELLAQK